MARCEASAAAPTAAAFRENLISHRLIETFAELKYTHLLKRMADWVDPHVTNLLFNN